MKPTAEQDEVVDRFLFGDPLAVQARAGTGKTSTLVMLGDAARPRRCRYLAFNRSVIADARGRFGDNVSAFTAHSAAFRAVGRPYAHRLNSGRVRSEGIAHMLGLAPIVVDAPTGPRTIEPGTLAGLVMMTLRRFCQSEHLRPQRWHTPNLHGIDLPGVWLNNNRVATHIAPAVAAAWRDICDPDGVLPFAHDHYLKMWQLSGAPFPAHVILYDEAQDASPVILAALVQQTHAQLVIVGDPEQCQPPDTLVTTADGGQVPIGELAAGDRVLTYRVSGGTFRRSGRRVAKQVTRPYDGALVTVSAGDRASRYTPNHWCLVRGKALADRWVVYLMRRGTSYRVGCCSWAYAAAAGPVHRARQEGADAVWVLDSFTTKRDALIAEASLAGIHGLPTITFAPVNGGSQFDADALTEVWAAIGDNAGRADRLLAEFGRDHRWPLWRASDPLNSTTARRPMRVRACNLISGMEVRLYDLGENGRADGRWQPATVSHGHYTGSVVSLDVEEDHNYVADGIATYNSIYGFTGAVNAMANIPDDAKVSLTQSFRFGPAVAEVANRVLALLDAAPPVLGHPDVPSRICAVTEPDAILCRTNASAVTAALSLMRAGRKVHVVGGATDVISFARAAEQLQHGRRTNHRDLACFATWPEVLDYVTRDPQGADLTMLVALVTEFGCRRLVEGLGAGVPEHAADVVISTAHKAKGREWDRVIIGDDFYDPARDMPDEELRLLYVAATRARHELDVTRCALLQPDPPTPKRSRHAPALPPGALALPAGTA